ncbi:MAG: stage III sporulation protein AG [Eubacterium sp.]|nr:stage III sporulation protein AG [Eubacterium sp.]
MKLKEFLQNKGWNKWDKSQWTILILAGVLLMVIAIPTNSPKKEGGDLTKDLAAEPPLEDTDDLKDYAAELEGRLEAALSQIEGAGRVKAMVTLEDAGESVIEKDTVNETSDLQETDSAGGNRIEKSMQTSRQSVYNETDSEKTPFVGREMTPKIAGVLVIAEGGENTAVKQNISEAVMALFQIDVNRIKVVKMNIQEDER